MILSLVLANSRRVAFEPTSDDGSMFTTCNIELQRMLEKHPWFGKKYSLSNETLAAMRRAAKEPQPLAGVQETSADRLPDKNAQSEVKDTQPTATPKIEKITVNGLADAKEILADRYEIMRTKLNTKAAILAAAKEHHIEFVGL